MAGIVAALESHDDVGLFRQPIDDLAFPFVAPLGADDDNIGHSRVFPSQPSFHASAIGSERQPTSGSKSPADLSKSRARPKIAAAARSHARQLNRIKEAGDLGKQEGHL